MLVGRGAETAAMGRLVADAREGRGGALVIRGEAGVGKSALLEQAAADASGFTVLRGYGVDVESELAYAALHQILRPAFGGIERLPEVQAAALRSAFALSTETVDERFRVSLGVLGLLSEHAGAGPLLCLVDDAQWLDQASADALLFVARRLEGEAIALVFTARDDDRPFVARGVPDLRLRALDPADARRLVSERLGSDVPPAVIEWLVQNANGNPLALMELPGTLSALQLSGRDPVAATLAPVTSVEQVYIERVARLSPQTQGLLVVAAAEETGARATVERAAAELEMDISDLAAAEAAGLLRVDAERIVLRHPLVRSAIYRGAAFTEREQAHRALAAAAAAEGSPDRAAWHRAAATVGTNEAVALDLESTAERARARSGHAAAASALDRAAELSPDRESQARRLVGAARSAWHAGQPERAAALVDRADAIVTDVALRADLDHLRGVMAWRCGSLFDASTILIAGAAEIAGRDPRKALEMLCDAALSAWDSGDYERLGAAGDLAAELPRSEDEEQALMADVLVSTVALTRGQTPDELPSLRRAIARSAEFDDPYLLIWAAIGAEMAGDDRLEEALLARAVALARASGAVDRLIVALESVAVQGFLAGRLVVGAEAVEGLRLAREADLPNAANLHLAALAWLAAASGRREECRAHAAEVAEAAARNRHGISNSIAQWAVALLELGLGEVEQAVASLTALSRAPAGSAHPFYVVASAPDLVEAALRAGRRDTAQAAAAVFAEFARPGAPVWALALERRCRALLATGEEAEQAFAEAVALHAHVQNPFEHARTELLFGEFLRRERRRSDARERLRAALESFERLGAEPWAERARVELRATGETARKRDPSTVDDLTPQELQIARLVGEGHSNKEIAAQLFLSPRTVEYHLRKVFAKLGIASRAELIRNGVDAGREPALAS
jgi:DNA-binding CsgD family transcriptional regulator